MSLPPAAAARVAAHPAIAGQEKVITSILQFLAKGGSTAAFTGLALPLAKIVQDISIAELISGPLATRGLGVIIKTLHDARESVPSKKGPSVPFRRRSAGSGGSGFARGTGYSSGDVMSTADPAAAREYRSRVTDRNMLSASCLEVLSAIVQFSSVDVSSQLSGSAAIAVVEESLLLADVDDILGLSWLKPLLSEVSAAPGLLSGRRFGAEPPPSPPDNPSPLPKLAKDAHTTLLRSVYKFVRALCGQPPYVHLLDASPSRALCIRQLLHEQEDAMSSFVAYEAESAEAEVVVELQSLLEVLTPLKSSVDEAVDVHRAMKAFAAPSADTPVGTVGAGPTPAAAAGKDADPHTVYSEAIRKLIVDGMPIVGLSDIKHHFAPSGGPLPACGVEATRRVAREIRGFAASLPSDFGSAVVVRYDRTRPCFMKAMIFGPGETPYDSGAFEFDIFCGGEYPAGPPKVNLVTTGGGSVRFNPNLYNCGKVCLSLLGTWRGSGPSEGWTIKSTILQVLVSIQGLIFVPFPYFNEPGVSGYGTSAGMAEARTARNGGYEGIREACVRWAMLDALEHPPKGFEEAVMTHFRLKRSYICGVITGWIRDGDKAKSSTHVSNLKAVTAALLRTFESKLGASPSPAESTLAGLVSGAPDALPVVTTRRSVGSMAPMAPPSPPPEDVELEAALAASLAPAPPPPMDDDLAAAIAASMGATGGPPTLLPTSSSLAPVPPPPMDDDLAAAIAASMSASGASLPPPASSLPPPPPDDDLAAALAASMRSTGAPAAAPPPPIPSTSSSTGGLPLDDPQAIGLLETFAFLPSERVLNVLRTATSFEQAAARLLNMLS